jgi:hypothetical protein
MVSGGVAEESIDNRLSLPLSRIPIHTLAN